MGKVYDSEIPGGLGMAWDCPYCSRKHPQKDVNGDDLECPKVCRRCGCDMDLAKLEAFSEKKAQEAAANGGPTRRRPVTV